MFGALFSNLLIGNLTHYLNGVSLPAGLTGASVSPSVLAKLPAAVHQGYVQAYADSLQTVFLVAVPVAAIAFLLSWLLPELPLRKTAAAVDPTHTFAMSADRSSLEELEHSLTELTRKENRPELYRRLAARANVPLDPAACWLLLHLAQHPEGPSRDVLNAAQLEPVVDRLVETGLVTRSASNGDGQSGHDPLLTAQGQVLASQLQAARRDGIKRLLDGWDPDEHPELDRLITKLATELQTADDARPATLHSGASTAILESPPPT